MVKRLDSKKETLLYNNKERMRTAPALCLGPTNSANDGYRFINLTNGQRFVSHIAYPREYDDEVRDLITALHRRSSDENEPNSSTGVPPTITEPVATFASLLSVTARFAFAVTV